MGLRVALCVLLCACGGYDRPTVQEVFPGPPPADAAVPDGTPPSADASEPDAAELADVDAPDAAVPDAAVPDARPPPDAAVPDARPPPDAAVPDARPPPDAAVPDARPPPDAAPRAWTDERKCEEMCQSYCVHLYMCNGSDVDECRMAIDEADGGTCEERAELFEDISQERVERCIAEIEAMSCEEFLRMYNTGRGVPDRCEGILI
jgi:hypothetical protein